MILDLVPQDILFVCKGFLFYKKLLLGMDIVICQCELYGGKTLPYADSGQGGILKGHPYFLYRYKNI